MPRGQDGPDQPGDVVVALAERLAQRLEQRVGRRGLLADEEVVELADQEPRRRRLLQHDAHHVAAVPGAGLPQDGLGAAVVQAGVEREAARRRSASR